MNSILIGNRLLRKNSPLLFNIFVRNAYTIKRLTLPLPIERRPTETFWDCNIRLGRPLSPCLSIYKKRFPLVISISHRITGIWKIYLINRKYKKKFFYLFSGLIQKIAIYSFSLSVIVLPCDFNFYYSMLPASIPLIPVCLGKGLIAYPVIYHCCTGIRHLLIDYGPKNLLRMKNVYKTGYIVFIASILLTVAAVMV